jgi:hypothetical protein
MNVPTCSRSCTTSPLPDSYLLPVSTSWTKFRPLLLSNPFPGGIHSSIIKMRASLTSFTAIGNYPPIPTRAQYLRDRLQESEGDLNSGRSVENYEHGLQDMLDLRNYQYACGHAGRAHQETKGEGKASHMDRTPNICESEQPQPQSHNPNQEVATGTPQTGSKIESKR